MSAETNSGPRILQAVRTIMATLVKAGVHDLSPWWWQLVEKFYTHPTALILTAMVGRGGDKTRTSVVMGIAELLAGGHVVPPGERHVFAHASENTREAAKTLAMYREFFRLLGVGFDPSGDGLDLRDMPLGVRVFASRVGAVSGFRIIGWTADENAKWDDAGADPSREVIASIKGMSITHPFARGRRLSSPMGALGDFFDTWRQGDTAAQVTGHGASWVANPGVTEEQCHVLFPDPHEFDREARAIAQGAAMAAWDPAAIEYAFRPLEIDAIVSGVVLGLDPAGMGQDAWGICAGGWAKRRVDPDEGFENTPLLREDGTDTGGFIVHRDRRRVPVEPPKPLLHFWSFATIGAAFRHQMEIDQIADRIATIARSVGAGEVATDSHEAFSLTSLLRQRGLSTHVYTMAGLNGARVVSRLRQLLNARAVHIDADERVKRQLLHYQEHMTARGPSYHQERDPDGTHFDDVSAALEIVRCDLENGLSGSPAGGSGGGMQRLNRRTGEWEQV